MKKSIQSTPAGAPTNVLTIPEATKLAFARRVMEISLGEPYRPEKL